MKGTRAACVAAAVFALVASVATSARAQYGQPQEWNADDRVWWPKARQADRVSEAPDGKGQERRVKTAAAMTGVSFGVMSAGLVTYIVSQTATEECGLTGCFTHPNSDLEFAGGALAAAGGGMALVAVPTLLDAMFVQRGAPRRAGRMGWGMALTSLGAGSAASVAFMAVVMAKDDGPSFLGGGFVGNTRTSIDRGVSEDTIIPMMIAQGLFAATYLGVGIPLWAAGGRSKPGGDPWPAELTIVPSGPGAALHAKF